MTFDKDFWTTAITIALTVGGSVFGAVWGFMTWLYKGVSSKLKQIERLGATLDTLKPKLEQFSVTLSELNTRLDVTNTDLQIRIDNAATDLQSRIDGAMAGVDKRLADGDKRFQTNELEFERSKRSLLETLQTATGESRKYHDQANEDFVRKEDLRANIVMVASEYCNSNCRDRK